jgi:hypothetical protein
MTKREALTTLIRAAIRDMEGQGRGIRLTTDDYRKKVREAIEKLWPQAYGYPMNDNDRYNAGW